MMLARNTTSLSRLEEGSNEDDEEEEEQQEEKGVVVVHRGHSYQWRTSSSGLLEEEEEKEEKKKKNEPMRSKPLPLLPPPTTEEAANTTTTFASSSSSSVPPTPPFFDGITQAQLTIQAIHHQLRDMDDPPSAARAAAFAAAPTTTTTTSSSSSLTVAVRGVDRLGHGALMQLCQASLKNAQPHTEANALQVSPGVMIRHVPPTPSAPPPTTATTTTTTNNKKPTTSVVATTSLLTSPPTRLQSQRPRRRPPPNLTIDTTTTTTTPSSSGNHHHNNRPRVAATATADNHDDDDDDDTARMRRRMTTIASPPRLVNSTRAAASTIVMSNVASSSSSSLNNNNNNKTTTNEQEETNPRLRWRTNMVMTTTTMKAPSLSVVTSPCCHKVDEVSSSSAPSISTTTNSSSNILNALEEGYNKNNNDDEDDDDPVMASRRQRPRGAPPPRSPPANRNTTTTTSRGGGGDDDDAVVVMVGRDPTPRNADDPNMLVEQQEQHYHESPPPSSSLLLGRSSSSLVLLPPTPNRNRQQQQQQRQQMTKQKFWADDEEDHQELPPPPLVKKNHHHHQRRPTTTTSNTTSTTTTNDDTSPTSLADSLTTYDAQGVLQQLEDDTIDDDDDDDDLLNLASTSSTVTSDGLSVILGTTTKTTTTTTKEPRLQPPQSYMSSPSRQQQQQQQQLLNTSIASDAPSDEQMIDEILSNLGSPVGGGSGGSSGAAANTMTITTPPTAVAATTAAVQSPSGSSFGSGSPQQQQQRRKKEEGFPSPAAKIVSSTSLLDNTTNDRYAVGGGTGGDDNDDWSDDDDDEETDTDFHNDDDDDDDSYSVNDSRQWISSPAPQPHDEDETTEEQQQRTKRQWRQLQQEQRGATTTTDVVVVPSMNSPPRQPSVRQQQQQVLNDDDDDSSSLFTTEDVMATTASSKNEDDKKKKKKKNVVDILPTSIAMTGSAARLQMFGSEYARYLSSTSALGRRRGVVVAGTTGAGGGSGPLPLSTSAITNNKKKGGGGGTTSINIPGRPPRVIGRRGGGGGGANRIAGVGVGGGILGGGSGSTSGGHGSGGGGANVVGHDVMLTTLLQDADGAVQTGAITDILAVPAHPTTTSSSSSSSSTNSTGQQHQLLLLPPKGYYKISPLIVGGDPATGRGGYHLLCKKEPNWDRAAQRPCVTALAVIFPNRNEFVPPGFCVVRVFGGNPVSTTTTTSTSDNSKWNKKKNHGSFSSSDTSSKHTDKGNKSGSSGSTSSSSSNNGPAANLGLHGGERVYLCYRRSREGNPMTGMVLLEPLGSSGGLGGLGPASNKVSSSIVPPGYTVIETTPRHFTADLTAGASNAPLFLGIRQRLASLEVLRPLPLVMVSVQQQYHNKPSSDSGSKQQQQQQAQQPVKLRAYYATGATTVQPSSVGRFHMMDRSTHPLLSPSSVTTRLTLIEAAAAKSKAGSGGGGTSSSGVGGGSTTPRSLASYVSSANLTADDGSSLNNDSYVGSEVTFVSGRSPSLIGMEDGWTAPTTDATTNSDGSMTPQGGGGGGGRGDHHHHSRKPNPIPELVGPHTNNAGGTPSTKLMPSTSSSLRHQLHRAAVSASAPGASASALTMALASMSFIPHVEAPNSDPMLSDEGRIRALETRSALLTPILTACYSQHGGAALQAVEGLSKLLCKTDFFDADLKAGANVTLLDLTVQAVCDVATSSSRETYFMVCLEFVEKALRYGTLNTRTVGYVLRFYLFVFYFGASIPTSVSKAPWGSSSSSRKTILPERSVVGQKDVPLLQDITDVVFPPGGAPQAAALAMKSLISVCLGRIGQVRLSSDSTRHEEELPERSQRVVVMGVKGLVNLVDLSNYCQLALHQIHRSGGSELFWHDMMTSCGSGLFDDKLGESADAASTFRVSFALLANLVKISAGKLRKVSDASGNLLPRDVSSKLVSLEFVLHYLDELKNQMDAIIRLENDENTDTKKREATEKLVYAVRRLVVPCCLLSNTLAGLQDARVFRRMLQIISKLFRTSYFRNHLKMELGVLVEHFGIGLLQLQPQLTGSSLATAMGLENLATGSSETAKGLSAAKLLGGDATKPLQEQQVDLLFEIKRWFEVESSVVDFFLNFDTDIASQYEQQQILMHQWKLYQQLSIVITSIAEQSTEFLVDKLRDLALNNQLPLSPTSQSGNSPTNNKHAKEEAVDDASARQGARNLQQAAFAAQAQMIHGLGAAVARSRGDYVWKAFRRQGDVGYDDDDSDDEPLNSSAIVPFNRPGDEGILSYWQTAIAQRTKSPAKRRSRGLDDSSGSHMLRMSAISSVTNHRNSAETLEQGFEIMEAKSSIKKGIEFLVQQSALSSSPRDIAAFLRMHYARFDPTSLGDYLGEGGLEGVDDDFWNELRFDYVRAISFVGMNAEQGLRHFLTNCGFKLPGEAQRIDRIVTTFSQCYWEDNAGDTRKCPFSDQDTVFLISFAIIMLNTDLHKNKAPSSSRMRGRKRKIKKMTKEEFTRNLRGVEGTEQLSDAYIGAIYDSIQEHPIELFEDEPASTRDASASNLGTSSRLIRVATIGGKMENRDLRTVMRSMMKNVKKSEELLRGLSVHEYTYYSVQHYADAIESTTEIAVNDLVRSAFSLTWNHSEDLIQTVLDGATVDVHGVASCLELLHNCLALSMLLALTEELHIFMKLLARVKFYVEHREEFLLGDPADSKSLRGEWAMELMNTVDDTSLVSALERLHSIVEELQDSLDVDTEQRRDMVRVARRLRGGHELLGDPTRFFLKEGDLMKRGRRMGRYSKYRFFLFSDMLVYSKWQPGSGDYKISDELPLQHIKIVDWFPAGGGGGGKRNALGMEIHHIRKSINVMCSNPSEKIEWVQAIRTAAEEHRRRLQQLVDPSSASSGGVAIGALSTVY